MGHTNSYRNKTRIELLEEFEAAPHSTLFAQIYLCAILDCSPATPERDRWAGNGVPFIKIGRAVRYRKSDILTYLNAHKTRQSTVELKTVGGR